LFLLSPLLVCVALAIRLTSRGPILFRQVRVGLHGRPFNILKFRSMVDGADRSQKDLLALNEQRGPVFKIRNDPRVTAVGRFIRKHSIDELPQILNVLRGDMSLVGPRPPVPDEVAQYEPWQWRRLSMRPGLTCFWQVSGRSNIDFSGQVKLDVRYIETAGFWVDIKILARTVSAVMAGDGAS
jgi:lipopolysaccharide/colanic/teichoic acid biosynthesis glycosyltransferase